MLDKRASKEWCNEYEDLVTMNVRWESQVWCNEYEDLVTMSVRWESQVWCNEYANVHIQILFSCHEGVTWGFT